MTYGRSGSTLLMGLLNTIPGYLIRGENDDAMRYLYEFHRTCVERSTFWPIERMRMRSNPFFGMGDFPVAASIAGARRLALETLLRPKADTRVTGFKEIRWWRHDDLDAYVAWLREVFPGARFLVNTRSHEAVLKSKWWAKGGDKSGHLADIERRLLETADRLGDAAYRVHFDDYVADPPPSRRCSPGWARSSTRRQCGRPCPRATRSELIRVAGDVIPGHPGIPISATRISCPRTSRESRSGSLMLLVRRLPRCELVAQVKPVVEGRALRRGHHPEPGMAPGPLASGHDALFHQRLVIEVDAHELDRFQSHAPESVGAGYVLAVLGAAAVDGTNELAGQAGPAPRAGPASPRTAPPRR